MTKSACRAYVTWFNHRSEGNWATWEPGELVTPGDVGRFDEHKKFSHWFTLSDFGVPFVISEERPIAPRVYARGKAFQLESKVAGKATDGLNVLGKAEAGVRLTATEEHASLLQIREATEANLLDPKALLLHVAELVRAGRWELDLVIVFARVRAREGFAAISRGAGQTLDLKAAGDVQVTSDLEIGGVDLRLASSRKATEFLLYEFVSNETPIFMPPLRVRSSLWRRLLPWQRDHLSIVDPTGKSWPVDRLPWNLSFVGPRDRCYDPARSAMSHDELAATPVTELFEELRSLADGLTPPTPKGGQPVEERPPQMPPAGHAPIQILSGPAEVIASSVAFVGDPIADHGDQTAEAAGGVQQPEPA